MTRKKVLVTDYAWPNLDIEREILGSANAELVVARSGDEAELALLAGDVSAILTNWKKVSPAVLDAAPKCLHVARYGVGLDNIAVDHATKLGMLVTNVPDYCIDEVQEHTMALLLACSRKIAVYDRQLRAKRWDNKDGKPLFRLRGQTLGIVGFGNIARGLVPKALGFGMEVIVYSPSTPPGPIEPHVTAVSDVGVLFEKSDFVTLHVPLTPKTSKMVNAALLARMKPTAFLINTARGAVIDEGALIDALKNRRIAGAALDVFEKEPAPPDHPLLSMDNVIVTPHAAFFSEESINDLQRSAARQVAGALGGALPKCVVNPAVFENSAYRLKVKP